MKQDTNTINDEIIKQRRTQANETQHNNSDNEQQNNNEIIQTIKTQQDGTTQKTNRKQDNRGEIIT